MSESALETRLGQYAGTLFYGLLAAGFVSFALLESSRPRRTLQAGPGGRWGADIGLFLLDSVLLRALQPVAAAAVAYYVDPRCWRLLNLAEAPLWLAIPASILIIDLGRYLEPAGSHQFKPLWRVHRVHHTDLRSGCTTGLRFHPLEARLGLSLDTLLITAFGMPPLASAMVALLCVTETLFNHANLQLPLALDRALRRVIVTPDMHRVRHSAPQGATDSKDGVLLPWWDRLFGTYRAQPRAGHAAMQMGLEEFREPRRVRLGRLLWLACQPTRVAAPRATLQVSEAVVPPSPPQTPDPQAEGRP